MQFYQTQSETGNLRTNSSGTGAIRGTFKYPKTGKWYYEVEPIDDAQYNTGYFHVGIATANANLNTNPGYDTTNEFTYWQNGSKTNNVAYGASFTAGDIIGVAFDAGAGSLTFYKNGVSQGVNSTGLTGIFSLCPNVELQRCLQLWAKALCVSCKQLSSLEHNEPPDPDDCRWFGSV